LGEFVCRAQPENATRCYAVLAVRDERYATSLGTITKIEVAYRVDEANQDESVRSKVAQIWKGVPAARPGVGLTQARPKIDEGATWVLQSDRPALVSFDIDAPTFCSWSNAVHAARRLMKQSLLRLQIEITWESGAALTTHHGRNVFNEQTRSITMPKITTPVSYFRSCQEEQHDVIIERDFIIAIS